MANVKNNASSQATCRRLLEAAGEVFAEKGFHSATIKEITQLAGASVASVNYHFRDKAELHAAVLRRIEQDAALACPPDEILLGSAEERFTAFVRHFVVTLLGRGQAPWERILIAREFAQPTPARDSIFENIARPIHNKLGLIVAEITGRPSESRDVALASVSIIGQCIYHLQHQSYLVELFPKLGPTLGVEQVAEQITAFSLAGLRGMLPRSGDEASPAQSPA